jgi:hypothetical protein
LDPDLSLGLGLGLFWVTVVWVTVVQFLEPDLFLGLGLGLNKKIFILGYGIKIFFFWVTVI